MHPDTAGVTEQEVQSRLGSIKVALGLTLIVCLGAVAYVLGTWDQENRIPMLAVLVLGLISAPAIWGLPQERIVRSRWCNVFFTGWSIVDIALIAGCAALDGGSESPFTLLLILPILFACLSYPFRAAVVVATVDLVALFVLSYGLDSGLPLKGFGLFAGVCVVLLASWQARVQSRQREELAETASALARSERSSRLQAREQLEVARFGQLALEGAETGELGDEASRIMARVLGVDYGAVMKLMPGGEELLLVAAVGVPDEMIGTALIPVNDRSQDGYALATGGPVVVDDWETETRFEMTEKQSTQGIRSAAAVLIKAKGHPYGVMGAGSTAVHDFSQEDVNFLQAIANILANAIERRSTEEETEHEALHDGLTGLPNRTLFLDRLEHALSGISRRSSSIAVLFLDLDQFKMVNDSLGHAAGDELLAAVAPRLEGALRPGDTVARFGGDEFAVLVEDVSNERSATRVAERIAEGLARPFILREREHFVSASIGISIGRGPEQPAELIRDADAALYRAKERGRGGYEIFDEVMRSRVIEHVQIENDLRRAIQREELALHYQPIVRLSDGAVVAMEALLRWNHPERGLIGPVGFIPVAEESRLIVPIGRWVIDQACRQAAVWQRLNPDAAPVSVAVNLSARQVADPDLLGHIERAIRANAIDPANLWLELTESTLIDDTVFVERTLESLRGLGVRLVLDDFGVGFSSLGYLKRLPLSMLKLDRSFVENITESAEDAAIVHAVSEMAETIGIGVVAEGVETPEQVRSAAELGCGFAQGFHFTEPVPAAEVEALLATPMPVVR